MIEIVPYNPKWPEMFAIEAELLEKALGNNFVAIHHVGSTSVPGLCAKPKIDIIAVVKDLKKVSQLGYRYRGEFNIPFHSLYTKRDDGLDINLHIFEEDNPEIELNLLFRDYLRNNPKACAEYAALKMDLVGQEALHKKNGNMFTGYNLGKNDFIQKILKLAGFNRLLFKYCAHHAEWEAYYSRQEQIFTRMEVEYDPNHYCISDPQHKHFVLYKGTDIVGVAHIEFLSLSDAALRPFAIDEPYQNQGFGSEFLTLIERWVKSQGRSVIRLNAEPRAIPFYQRLGYDFIEFIDHHKKIEYETVAMGKFI